MDSLTQIVLGAAVGEFMLGKKVGNKAILWGAVAGTIPDLDVLSNLFLNDLQSLLFHRGITHSIFFAVVISPLLAYLVDRLYKNSEANFRDWLSLFFWCIVTHPMLDIFTNYGTQLFYPFSDYRVAFNTIFVIDPIFTLPLLAGCMMILLTRNNKKRDKINKLSLIISITYLSLTCFNKLLVNSKLKEKIEKQNISYIETMTTPAPFTNILWSVIVKSDDSYQVGYFSWFDGSNDLHLTTIPRKEDLLKDYLPNDNVEKLIAFSKGFYELEKSSNGLIFNDLRFSTISGWFNIDDAYIFSFLLQKVGDEVEITKIEPEGRLKKENFKKLMYRIMGDNNQLNGN